MLDRISSGALRLQPGGRAPVTAAIVMAIVAVRIIVDHQSLKVGARASASAASFRLMPKAHGLSPWPVAQDPWGAIASVW